MKRVLKSTKKQKFRLKNLPQILQISEFRQGGGVKHFHIVPKFKIVPRGERVRRALENFTMF